MTGNNKNQVARKWEVFSIVAILSLSLVLAACGGLSGMSEELASGNVTPVEDALVEEGSAIATEENTASLAEENTIALNREVTRDLGSSGSVTFRFPEDWVIVDGDTLTTFAYNVPGVENRITNFQPGDLWLEFNPNNGSVNEDPADQVQQMTAFMDDVEFSEPLILQLGEREGATIHGVNRMCGGCETQLLALKNPDGTYIQITAYLDRESFETYQPFLQAFADTIVWTPAK